MISRVCEVHLLFLRQPPNWIDAIFYCEWVLTKFDMPFKTWKHIIKWSKYWTEEQNKVQLSGQSSAWQNFWLKSLFHRQKWNFGWFYSSLCRLVFWKEKKKKCYQLFSFEEGRYHRLWNSIDDDVALPMRHVPAVYNQRHLWLFILFYSSAYLFSNWDWRFIYGAYQSFMMVKPDYPVKTTRALWKLNGQRNSDMKKKKCIKFGGSVDFLPSPVFPGPYQQSLQSRLSLDVVFQQRLYGSFN